MEEKRKFIAVCSGNLFRSVVTEIIGNYILKEKKLFEKNMWVSAGTRVNEFINPYSLDYKILKKYAELGSQRNQKEIKEILNRNNLKEIADLYLETQIYQVESGKELILNILAQRRISFEYYPKGRTQLQLPYSPYYKMCGMENEHIRYMLEQAKIENSEFQYDKQTKIRLLTPHREISDPYAQEKEVFEEMIEDITKAVHTIIIQDAR